MTDDKAVTNTVYERRHIHVDGVVQGVGFRPFIYGLAMRYDLPGWVLNSSSGVDIAVDGLPAILDAFQQAITAEAPPLAQIDRVTGERIAIDDEGPFTAFTIRHSTADTGTSLISPDVATCVDCRDEIFDPANRRYRYPFTNCTNCGPRYTIIQAMPYDRPQTTMRTFPLCPDCLTEYENPLDRRFHAQPNACPVCGPQVALVLSEGITLPDAVVNEDEDGIAQAAALLRAGYIVAIKGLGGFHIACDATNAQAVARLRTRKMRPAKPFAVMMDTLQTVRQYCTVNAAEAALLEAVSAPVVLLYTRPDHALAAEVSPDNPMLGVMLPYTPLHHLLLRDVGRPLVMTSGNLSDMPIITANDEALEKLAPIVDAWLLHNRPIHMRCDDAVWWVDRFAGEAPTGGISAPPLLDTAIGSPADAGTPRTKKGDAALQPLRRSRGDAPYPVRLTGDKSGHILATGAEMKNTFCLLRGGDAFLSQHIGEVDSLESLAYFRESLDHLRRIFKVDPQIIAHDLHPDYLTTRLAHELAVEWAVVRVAVQHHHAHIAACLAEHGVSEPVIGLALDGTGYGPDGAIWGGEVLVADVQKYQRLAHLAYMPLPGGAAAIRKPYRMAWAYLLETQGEIPPIPTLSHALSHINPQEQQIITQQVNRRLNTPLTSSCGRLFDAVAALLGICPVTTFEAQAAIALELAAREVDIASVRPYSFTLADDGILPVGDLLAGVVRDGQQGRPVNAIAAAFHVTLVALFAEAVARVRGQTGLDTVALSGGVFQNRLFLRLMRERLRQDGFVVLSHQQVPANDGGLCLGQAVVAQQTMA
ncbi:carbamoyltransferase HypF [Chloroflexota bacterium]